MFKQATPVDIHIGKKLRVLRSIAGISLDEIGELVGLTLQQIQKYETGVNKVSASKLFEIAQILEVPISAFFDDYVADPYYYNIDFKKDKDQLESQKSRNKEIIALIRAFNKIPSSQLRKDILTMLASISDLKKRR